MRYYIGSVQARDDYLEHFGIKGMKWGRRRYENYDGTLTPSGRARYQRAKNYYNNNRDQIRKAARIAGAAAAIGGAAYLGYRNRGAIRKAGGAVASAFRNRKTTLRPIRPKSRFRNEVEYTIGKASNAFNNAKGKAQSRIYEARRKAKNARKSRPKNVHYKGWVKDAARSYAGKAQTGARKAAEGVKSGAKKAWSGYNDYMNSTARGFRFLSKRQVARAVGRGAAIGLAPYAAAYGVQSAYDRWGKNPSYKSNHWRKKHGYKANVYGVRYN